MIRRRKSSLRMKGPSGSISPVVVATTRNKVGSSEVCHHGKLIKGHARSCHETVFRRLIEYEVLFRNFKTNLVFNKLEENLFVFEN